ncbi:MAG: hypothetical protein JWR37_1033 [Mycobacterium sp.]|nr:hypothetical protein [Mycobacterium sp.]
MHGVGRHTVDLADVASGLVIRPRLHGQRRLIADDSNLTLLSQVGASYGAFVVRNEFQPSRFEHQIELVAVPGAQGVGAGRGGYQDVVNNTETLQVRRELAFAPVSGRAGAVRCNGRSTDPR